MGLNGGSKCIYISSKLTAKEFYCILQDRYNDNIYPKDGPNFRRPTVDIDANEIAFRYINSAMGPAGSLLGIAKSLSLLGIDVNIVGDPVDFRYDTKRVTVERKAKRERARLQCINDQAKLNQMLQDSRVTDPLKLKAVEKEIVEIMILIKKHL